MSTPAAEGPRIRHLIPGRVRIHWPGWSGQAGPALEAHLSRLPGVRTARANPLTGTLLIYFDPGVTDEHILLDALQTGESGGMGCRRQTPTTLPLPHSGRRGFAGKLAAAAEVLVAVQSLPLLRDVLRHLLGRPLADLLLFLTKAVVALLAAEPLDLLLAAADSVLPLPAPLPRLLAG